MNDFERVKDAVDFLQFAQRHLSQVKRTGTHYKAVCVFHDDHDPSMTLYADSYHCFVCGATGDVFDLDMRLNNHTKQESLIALAQQYGVTLTPLTPEAKQKQDERERLYALMEDCANLYEKWLWGSPGERALRYLRETRNLSDDTIKAARIGFTGDQGSNALCSGNLIHMGYSDNEQMAVGMAKRADDDRMYDTFRNRVMIPIRDTRGRIVAFSGRAMETGQTPKYLHNATNDIFRKSEIVHRMPISPPTSAIDAFKTIVAVEGTLDPASALNRGFYNVVSVMGTSLTDEQLKLLCKGGVSRIVLCFDNDTTGEDALKRNAKEHLHTAARLGVDLMIMRPPHGKDPDDTFRERPELWQPAVDAARPVVDVLIDLELSSLGENPTGVQKSNMARALLPVIKNDDPFITKENLKSLSSRVDIPVSDLEAWVSRQPYVMPKPAPVVQVSNALGVPTTEEWVLHGILVNDHDDWLSRANALLTIASYDAMPYALSPLSIQDFSEAAPRRVMDLILKGANPVDLYVEGTMDIALRLPYERIARLDIIGREFGLAFDFNVFAGRVYALRLKRLRAERPTYEGKEPLKARECAMAIGCLMMSQEEIL